MNIPLMADMYSCDQVAECMDVSAELSTALWAALDGVVATVSAENCSSSFELAQCNGTTVAARWDCFTSTQQDELFELLK